MSIEIKYELLTCGGCKLLGLCADIIVGISIVLTARSPCSRSEKASCFGWAASVGVGEEREFSWLKFHLRAYSGRSQNFQSQSMSLDASSTTRRAPQLLGPR